MKELGERLRRLRESVKLSQVKMAELLGVKQSSINRYEQGQSAPSLETLVRYADYFDVSLDLSLIHIFLVHVYHCRYDIFPAYPPD